MKGVLLQWCAYVDKKVTSPEAVYRVFKTKDQVIKSHQIQAKSISIEIGIG